MAKNRPGEKLVDLPVQQSTKVELIINLKTAKALRSEHGIIPAVASEAGWQGIKRRQ